MKTVNIKKLPIMKDDSICLRCENNKACPMIDALKVHKENVSIYGEHYENERPDLWDLESIDEPEYKNGIIEWCPLYEGER